MFIFLRIKLVVYVDAHGEYIIHRIQITKLLIDGYAVMKAKLRDIALKETKLDEGKGTQKKGKNFQLFQNEITNTNNIILIQSKEINWVYTTFDSPNYMVNKEIVLVEYTKDWFDRIQKRSRLISGSESSCLGFFNILEQRIKATDQELR